MSQPFIPVAAPSLSGNERKYVLDCLESTWISSAGTYLERFEAEFARFCEASYAIAVNNGTTALHLALVALGIGEGDEVIVPTLTYIASANAVRYCQAVPVFADCNPRTLNLDPEILETYITPQTKAILPVHLYGHPVDMDAVREVAQAHKLLVIEDAAEAHGARYKGRRVGGLGDCGTFSFYGNKILTTGEGGMVVTNDPDLAARLRLYRGQGVDPNRRYHHPVIGFNYRMTNIAAAIGLAQLERFDQIIERRRQVAEQYSRQLSVVSPSLRLLSMEAWAETVPWLMTAVLTSGSSAERDALMSELSSKGIDTRPVFIPMHQQPPYLEDVRRYPVASLWASRGLNLPTFEALTENDVDRVCDAVINAVRSTLSHHG